MLDISEYISGVSEYIWYPQIASDSGWLYLAFICRTPFHQDMLTTDMKYIWNSNNTKSKNSPVPDIK